MSCREEGGEEARGRSCGNPSIERLPASGIENGRMRTVVVIVSRFVVVGWMSIIIIVVGWLVVLITGFEIV